MNILLPQFSEFISVLRQFAIKCRLRGVSESCRSDGGGHTDVQGRTASGDSSGGEHISQPGMRSSEPRGFRGNARVCKFHATDYGMNTCMVHSRGFGCAAGFRMFQLRVQEGATTSALATSHPDSLTQSFLQQLWTGDEIECVGQDNRMCAV